MAIDRLSRTHRRRWLLQAAASACAWIAPEIRPAAAQTPVRATETAVKAAYVVRFLNFVEWPEAAAATTRPLVIGILAGEDMVEQLTALASGRKVNGRELQVRRVARSDAAGDLDVLFAGRPWRGSTLAESVQARPVLVVTDQGLDEVAMLNLLRVDGRIGFEASTLAAGRAGIRLSARLLAIAERVVR